MLNITVNADWKNSNKDLYFYAMKCTNIYARFLCIAILYKILYIYTLLLYYIEFDTAAFSVYSITKSVQCMQHISQVVPIAQVL